MAIKKVYELSVDLKKTTTRVNVPVLVQGDSAELRIRLLDNGAELSTEQLTGITAVRMQSGYDAQTVIQTVGTLQGSVAVFRLQKGELFRSGTVQAMVQLEDTEDRISTLRFQYQVIPDLAGNYIPGEQDITVFQRYMNEAQAKIDEMAATDVAQLTVKLADTAKQIGNLENYINVLDYGAVGDGIADDTSSLENAIAAAISTGKKNILIPIHLSIYKPSKINVAGSSIEFTGLGFGTSKIIFKHKDGGFNFHNPNGNGYIYEIKFKDISISGDNVCDTLITGTKCEQFDFNNVNLARSASNLAIFTELNLTNFKKLYLAGDDTNPTLLQKGIKLINSGFNSIKEANIWYMDTIFELSGGIGRLNVIDSWFEKYKKGFLLSSSTSTISMDINLKDNYYLNGSGESSLITTDKDYTSISLNLALQDNKIVFGSTATFLNNAMIFIHNHTSGEVILSLDNNRIEVPSIGSLKWLGVSSETLMNLTRIRSYFNNYPTSLSELSAQTNYYFSGIETYGLYPRVADGLRLYKAGSDGRISYDPTNKVVLLQRGDTVSTNVNIPIQGVFVPQSTATTIEGLKTDLNNLITALRNSKALG